MLIKEFMMDTCVIRLSVLAERLSVASTNQLVLVPLNVGYHWILTVIDPYKEMVYLLDSLGHRNRYDDWKYVVDMSVRLFNSNKERKGKKQAIWEVVKFMKTEYSKEEIDEVRSEWAECIQDYIYE
ncbi:uncharacterized protein [Primulina eburnea]|uniref:uncharacterized protein isoform X2 n=1 Tax=Primulina eburnea TaxID=1245227 RepID=UPI003C6C667B